MLRLRQVFAAKTAKFREVLSEIVGVNVVFSDNGQVRVTSQYDLGAAFVFQPAQRDAATKHGGTRNSRAAQMQLVAQGEGGPQELPQLMRNWVEIEQSIPCFLASVTLECYDKLEARARDEWRRGVREGTVGGPACIYCAAHNTQYTFLALIASTWTERRKAVRGTSWRPGHRITQHWQRQRLNSPHEGYTRPDNVSFQLQPHTLYHASLLVYRDLSSTYCEAP